MLARPFVRKTSAAVTPIWPLCLLRGEAIDLPKLTREVRPAVVLIEVQNANGQTIGTATGFFISADGTMVTNCHVVENGATFIVKVETGAFYVVKEIRQKDRTHDLAILKVDAKGVPFLRLNQAGDIEAGSPIAVIGSPLGLQGSVSNGIVSAIREKDEVRFLQITAPISPGSSGSPVLDAKGEVVGMITSYASEGQNVNHAALADDVRKLASRPVQDDPFANLPPAGRGAQSVAKLDTSDPDFARAADFLSHSDPGSALKLLNELAKRYPDSSLVQLNFGEAYLKLGLLDDAIRSYRQVITAVPDSTLAWGNLAIVYLCNGQVAEGKTASETAIKLNPTDGFPWRVRGFYFLQIRQFQAAVEAFERSVKLAPDDAPNWRGLAFAYRDVGESAKAEAAEKKAIRIETETKKDGSPKSVVNDPHVDAVPQPPERAGVAARYSVTGIQPSDTLNVRSGPGMNHAITHKLPAGFKGIEIFGARVMNGGTEWVRISFPSHTRRGGEWVAGGEGWVRTKYLRLE
jgi:tetratricopeptide (TPR) repeat protein